MTWNGLWEAIASVFEDVLFIPYDALYKLELATWWGANLISWVFLLIGAATFTFWMLQLKNFNENTESTYTYKENH